MAFPYYYYLNNANYEALSQQDYRVLVTDADDAGLTVDQLRSLQAQGKGVNAYLSIGEAETYRDYWQQWGNNIPDYVLGENVVWEGNFSVKFWNKDWQDITLARAVDLAQQGYDGIYLDIIDAYQLPEVIAVYEGTESQLRTEMERFVIRLSETVKAVNPEIKVIPQNGVELLTEEGTSSIANRDYLNAIDGIGVEDLFYVGNQVAEWTQWDLNYINVAIEQGKFVLATNYSTDTALQQDFINKALDAGMIPFVGDRQLTGEIPSVNNLIEQLLPNGWSDFFSDIAIEVTTLTDQITFAVQPFVYDESGAVTGDVLLGGAFDDLLTGTLGADAIKGDARSDTLRGADGNDSVRGGKDSDFLYGDQGHDVLYGDQGSDSVRGGKGDDILYGAQGNDTLVGDRGDDQLWGAQGRDIFVYDGNGNDTIGDFVKGDDKIQIVAENISHMNELAPFISYEGNNAVISLGEKSLTVQMNGEYTLSEDDIFFA